MAIAPSLRPTLRAIAETILPGAAAFDQPVWDALDRIVSTAIRERPERMRRQLALFIAAIEWLPLFRYGKPFTRLDPARRHQFLAALQDSSFLLVRRGFWGLRTLILMGYYTQSRAAADIGYRADPRGWSIRR